MPDLRLIVDMNLPPEWTEVLGEAGIEAVHWSTVGDPRATDMVILNWAREHGYIVFTHDLDFGTLLAHTHASGPSVVQVRTQDVFPKRLAPIVIAALHRHREMLVRGALVTVDEARARVRVLPVGHVGHVGHGTE
jgi:predicted nuclease of predicted toxin-antitoxin system